MRDMLMRIQKYLQDRSPVFIFILGLLMILFIGILNHVTGAGYVLDFFYLLPLFFVTWFSSTRVGIIMAILAGLTWLVASQITGQLYVAWTREIWLTLIELAVFLTFVALISVRKRDVRILDNTLSLLNSTLESTMDGILVVNLAGKIVSINQRFSAMWGIPDTILAAHDDDQALTFVQQQLVRPEDFLLKVRELYSRLDEESFDLLDFKDGRIFERYSKPQRINESVVGRVWSFRDVTTSHLAIREKAQLAAIVDSSDDAVISKTPDGTIISWNRGAERIYGYTEKETIGKPISMLVPPGHEDEVPHILEKIKKGEYIEHYETVRRRKDGKDIYMSLTISPIQDAEGKIVAASTIGRDITIRKQAEKELEDSDTKLRSLFAAMTDVVIVYDREGHYIEIAPTDPGLLIEPPDQLIGKSMYDSFPKADADRLLQDIHTVLDTGRKVETEYSLQIGGRTTWFSCSISPMRADSVIWVAHDITNRKRAEKLQDVIYTISQTAISSESIDELYQSIHTTLAELVHVENFYIAIYDPTSNLVSFPCFVDLYDQPPSETKLRRGLTEYVLRSGQPLLAPAEVVDQLIHKGEIEDMGAPSIDWMGVPLKVEGQVIGVMVTQSYQETIHFNQDDLRLFEFVSTQVAQVIDRKRVEEKIRFLGMHDALTGLYNRAYFDEELKRLEHGRMYPISVLMADLDHLKMTNDRDGHAAGDELLRQAAQALRTAFRVEDVVARIGGDEFAVLLPGMDSSLARKAKQRIVDNITRENSRRPGNPLQISIGFSTVKKGGSLVEALKTADDQMYVEKKGKRSLE